MMAYLRHSAQLRRVAPFLRFFAGLSPPRASILLSYGGGGGIIEVDDGRRKQLSEFEGLSIALYR